MQAQAPTDPHVCMAKLTSGANNFGSSYDISYHHSEFCLNMLLLNQIQVILSGDHSRLSCEFNVEEKRCFISPPRTTRLEENMIPSYNESFDNAFLVAVS